MGTGPQWILLWRLEVAITSGQFDKVAVLRDSLGDALKRLLIDWSILHRRFTLSAANKSAHCVYLYSERKKQALQVSYFRNLRI